MNLWKWQFEGNTGVTMVLILECIVVCFILFLPCVVVIANGTEQGAFLYEKDVQVL